MEEDKLMPKTKCFSAIVKMDMRVLDSAFFSIAKDSECNAVLYETNYNKEIDKTMKQVATTYTSDIRLVNFSLPSQLSECKYESAESIVNMSYSQAEVYTSVNIRRVLTTCPYKILHEM